MKTLVFILLILFIISIIITLYNIYLKNKKTYKRGDNEKYNKDNIIRPSYWMTNNGISWNPPAK